MKVGWAGKHGVAQTYHVVCVFFPQIIVNSFSHGNIFNKGLLMIARLLE